MTDPVEIPSPYHRQVGQGDRSLMDELRWYLENFLEYPFDPWADRADRVLGALEQWGTEAFEALFAGGDGQPWLDWARQEGDVQIVVSADDPHVLSWPWEGLYDPRRDWLVHQHAVTRRLNDVDDPPPLPDLPDDRVNVLLVTARPLDEDAPYRSIARPLVETVKEQDLPASITVLRPPTFDNLREHLREHPGHYHVVHFDGHGGYLENTGTVPGDQHQLRGPQGHLVFETAGDFDPDPIPADRLSQLLREHTIPAAVLNACQSGMVDDAADDAFASVAASLLRAGVRSVVAMSHAVMVSGAQEFVPPFYERLFESGSLAEATRAGRQEMLAHPERVCARGRFPLQDWLVPVVYEQAEVPFDFAADAAVPTDDAPALPDPPEEVQGPYGFVGRDRELLQLERAMWRNPAGILFHGLGGIGKTTLVWGLLQWLADTGGLAHEPFWFTFSEIQSAEYVLNRIGERFYGEDFATLDTDEKLDRLVEALTEAPHILVWDNFESAAAMDEKAGEALLNEEDRETLRTLLRRLQGTGTKVLITCRSEEEWLGGPAHVQRHSLGGLQGEERWRFCEEIVGDLPGVTLDREDDAMNELMKTLRGHPLAMRVVLPRLTDRSPDDLRETIEHNLDDLDSAGDEALDRLYATLGLVGDVLDDELRELLIPLGLHERFVEADPVEDMAKQAGSSLTREQIEEGVQKLADIGLLHNVGTGVHAVHPALTGYLRARSSVHVGSNHVEEWEKAFVYVVTGGAVYFVRQPPHVQRTFVARHQSNIVHAKHLADRHGWVEAKQHLIEFLAVVAQNRQSNGLAYRRYRELLTIRESLNDESGISKAYHQLGIAAQGLGNLKEAEQWLHESVEMHKRQDSEDVLASTYHQLGRVALERGDLEEAAKWLRRSAEIDDDEQGLAKTYHLLGRIAQEQGNLEKAEQRLRKSAEITERLDDEYGAASAYHGLGIVAQERGELEEAKQRYESSAEIFEGLNDDYRAGATYHQLGRIAQEQGSLEKAEHWLRKSVEIDERLDNEHGAAKTYHMLGIVAHEQDRLQEAEQWYDKSAKIFEKLGRESELARTQVQRGNIARDRGNLRKAGQWLLRGIQGLRSANDTMSIQKAGVLFVRIFDDASADVKEDLRQRWIDAGLSEEQLEDALDQFE